MLTPQKIQELADSVEDIYINMVNELMVNIGKHITSPTWTHTASWEIQKLAELGQLTKENAAIINKWIKSVPQVTRDSMEATRREALERLETQMEQAARDGHVTPPITDSTQQVLRNYLSQAADRLNMVNTTMLQSSLDQYAKAVHLTASDVVRAEATQRTLNEAAGKLVTSTETRTEAVRKAIRQISAEGLTGFYDRAGRQWSPEAYVNMVMRTTVHNVAIESTKARMDDYGTTVFQVSSHAAARPRCYPYQGKFYSWDNSEGMIELGDGRSVHYAPVNTTSYGEAAGLFGINCGHEPIPIIPGVTIPHGEDNIQPKDENDKQYAESQQQRALERKIRAAKRAVEMGDDSPEAKAKVRAAQAEMREFIKETGRARRYDREQVVSAKGQTSHEPVKISDHVQRTDVTTEYKISAKPGNGRIIFDEQYNKTDNKREIKTAEWIHSNLGGDICLITDHKKERVKSPDYLWRYKLWDQKTTSTEVSANSAIKKGLQQIRTLPGGVILDYRAEKNTPDWDILVSVIDKRMQWYRKNEKVDIVVILKDDDYKVLRYSKA